MSDYKIIICSPDIVRKLISEAHKVVQTQASPSNSTLLVGQKESSMSSTLALLDQKQTITLSSGQQSHMRPHQVINSNEQLTAPSSTEKLDQTVNLSGQLKAPSSIDKLDQISKDGQGLPLKKHQSGINCHQVLQPGAVAIGHRDQILPLDAQPIASLQKEKTNEMLESIQAPLVKKRPVPPSPISGIVAPPNTPEYGSQIQETINKVVANQCNESKNKQSEKLTVMPTWKLDSYATQINGATKMSCEALRACGVNERKIYGLKQIIDQSEKMVTIFKNDVAKQFEQTKEAIENESKNVNEILSNMQKIMFQLELQVKKAEKNIGVKIPQIEKQDRMSEIDSNLEAEASQASAPKRKRKRKNYY